MSSFYVLIIGASSAIAQAAIQQFDKDPGCLGIFAVSRSLPFYQGEDDDSYPVEKSHNKIHWLICDNTESEIDGICHQLKSYSVNITKVLICNGLLHDEGMMPERKLEDINVTQLETILHANAITPMLWLSKLLPVLAGKEPTQMAIFSARVGSIADNEMGGWYSYRASKAALNMLIKTSAVEYARRAKNVKLIAFHPGTTDTPLSKPFQRSVAKDKLFSAHFVASQLLKILDKAEMNNKAEFLDWDNQKIEW